MDAMLVARDNIIGPYGVARGGHLTLSKALTLLGLFFFIRKIFKLLVHNYISKRRGRTTCGQG